MQRESQKHPHEKNSGNQKGLDRKQGEQLISRRTALISGGVGAALTALGLGWMTKLIMDNQEEQEREAQRIPELKTPDGKAVNVQCTDDVTWSEIQQAGISFGVENIRTGQVNADEQRVLQLQFSVGRGTQTVGLWCYGRNFRMTHVTGITFSRAPNQGIAFRVSFEPHSTESIRGEVVDGRLTSERIGGVPR